jgi:mannose/fructose/N-acetylgalactosamine-specific phosphotransferase system component IID
MRNYTSESTNKKNGGNGLIVATLVGLGVAGGLYYNQSSSVSSTTGAAAVGAPTKASFDPNEFKAFKVSQKKKEEHGNQVKNLDNITPPFFVAFFFFFSWLRKKKSTMIQVYSDSSWMGKMMSLVFTSHLVSLLVILSPRRMEHPVLLFALIHLHPRKK